ncbi:MAG TPA: sulfite exporter TauE/SafE family protein, partial [Chondromyces sp.]|nr:sulfite exporter TauE/SafE family protein [Chondromyces sp.]
WGPITTPVLLSKNGMSARKVVGTVDTSEFAIAISATLGFLISLGWEVIAWTWAIALIIGGVIAAPIAAWLVRIVPAQLMGVLVGGFIILTNARTMLTTWIENDAIYPIIYGLIAAIWLLGIFYAIYKFKQEKKAAEKKVPFGA